VTGAAAAGAYDSAVDAASQAEMEAGTESGIRRMSPLRVAQAIAARNTDLATLHALALSF
jgi:hypothetical protein